MMETKDLSIFLIGVSEITFVLSRLDVAKKAIRDWKVAAVELVETVDLEL